MNAHEHDHDDFESEPLLAGEERDSLDDTPRWSPTQPDPGQGHPSHENKKHGWRGFARFQAQKRTTVVVLLAVLMFAVVTSGMLFMIPIFRLMEDAVCHLHYDKPASEPIEERLCKVDGVQKELAFLGGVGAMINSLVGLVATLPYGVLADR
jgi:hypothetical protein